MFNSNLNFYNNHIKSIIIIQKYTRGFLFRINKLPLIFYIIQKFLLKQNFIFSNAIDDGRINSNFDENNLINILYDNFPNKISKPSIRNWFDIAVYDNYYGWLPVNIKSTKSNTADNAGNLSICVQSYTNYILDLKKYYDNGNMSTILFDKLKNNEINKNYKKDYYFIVLNKSDNKDIIINSIKGLSSLTGNLNNLPFQIKWCKNKHFIFKNIKESINQFINVIKNPSPSWKETFLSNIRNNF